jgi:hypothetical protein
MVNYALRPAFTPLTLLLMILGFIFFWPLGLAMLAYMIWGHRFPEVRRHFDGMKDDMKRDWARSWDCGPRGYSRSYQKSGNAAFDDYREKEMKRMEEERRRLDEELREFEAYMNDLRRARDAEEFDRFQRDRSNRPRNGGSVPETKSNDV